MSNAVPAVRLESVSKAYGTLKAADNTSLSVYPGEFFSLLGASGSGKTTLLRLIGGFETPDQGNIWLSGENISTIPAHQRNVHTVFQDYALFPHLSILENVAYPLRIRRVAPQEVIERSVEALKLVRLAEFGDSTRPDLLSRKPDQLSGGQRQRVALARAIVNRPSVLLLDEPLSALDAQIRVELREELKQLQRQTGISFIYITHDQEEALALSDRIAVMQAGKILQIGTPLAVYENPANLYVATFVGRANCLAGQFFSQQEEQGQIQVADCLISGRLGADSLDLAKLQPVQMVIRPEYIRLSREPLADGYSAQVLQTQYLGYATSYLLQTLGHQLHALELRHQGMTPYQEGEALWCQWNSTDALIFGGHSMGHDTMI
jgi:spermidine/putrescine transport system ATP-binding protein